MRAALALWAFALLSGCNAATYVRQAIISSAVAQDIESDGETFRLVRYTTDPDDSSRADSVRTVYFIGGSGCTSLRTYLAPYFAALPRGYQIVGLEKTGSEANSLGRTCSADFQEHYRYDEMLRRNRIALNLVEERLGRSVDALFGVSEGGPQVFELAAERPDIDRVIVLGAGGLTQREELRLLAARTNRENELDEQLELIAANPDSVDTYSMGYPYAYWSSVLDRDIDNALARIQQATLIIIGQEDQSVPVASAQRAHALLPNSQLIIWPGANHVFATSEGSQRDEVVARTAEFIETGL